MQILKEGNEDRGRFYVEEEGRELAESVWSMRNGKLVIEHTEVLPGGEGKGLGKKLVTHVVSYAREQGLKIIPVCPFAKALFEKIEEWKDVWG